MADDNTNDNQNPKTYLDIKPPTQPDATARPVITNTTPQADPMVTPNESQPVTVSDSESSTPSDTTTSINVTTSNESSNASTDVSNSGGEENHDQAETAAIENPAELPSAHESLTDEHPQSANMPDAAVQVNYTTDTISPSPTDASGTPVVAPVTSEAPSAAPVDLPTQTQPIQSAPSEVAKPQKSNKLLKILLAFLILILLLATAYYFYKIRSGK